MIVEENIFAQTPGENKQSCTKLKQSANDYMGTENYDMGSPFSFFVISKVWQTDGSSNSLKR